jgi:hypothetical protein
MNVQYVGLWHALFATCRRVRGVVDRRLARRAISPAQSTNSDIAGVNVNPRFIGLSMHMKVWSSMAKLACFTDLPRRLRRARNG